MRLGESAVSTVHGQSYVVDNVYDVSAGGAVLVQQGLDGLARLGNVLHRKVAVCVLVLRVDDNEDRVLGRCCRRRDTNDLTERLGRHC